MEQPKRDVRRRHSDQRKHDDPPWFKDLEILDHDPLDLRLPFSSKPCVSPPFSPKFIKISLKRRASLPRQRPDQHGEKTVATARNTFGYCGSLERPTKAYEHSARSQSMDHNRTSPSKREVLCDDLYPSNVSTRMDTRSTVLSDCTSWYSDGDDRSDCMNMVALCYPHSNAVRNNYCSDAVYIDLGQKACEEAIKTSMAEELDEYHRALLDTTSSPSLRKHYKPSFRRTPSQSDLPSTKDIIYR